MIDITEFLTKEELYVAMGLHNCGITCVIVSDSFHAALLQLKQESIRRERKLNKRGIRSHFNSAEWDFLK